MSIFEREAYRAGYDACYSGVHSSACPNQYQGALRYAWKDGWMAAHETKPW